MNFFDHLQSYEYGEVHLRFDEATGLKAIVAIHDTRLGPSLGGCRFVPYESDGAALIDALRLARGMTYKAALAGLAHGGGKSVIIRPKTLFDRAALFGTFGKFVDDLGGRYITAEDSGTTTADMDVVRTRTRHVTGVGVENGGSGDPSPFTALGVRRGIEACIKEKLGRQSLEGVRVAIQGVGHVGYFLCKELRALGALLWCADTDSTKCERVQKEFGAQIVDLHAIYDVPCDVFAPCALGAILHHDTIGRIKAKIIAGAANNQLATPENGDELHARGILYAPDYAINAGGLINVAQEVTGYNAVISRERTLKIYDTIAQILDRSRYDNIPTHRVADSMAKERLASKS